LQQELTIAPFRAYLWRVQGKLESMPTQTASLIAAWLIFWYSHNSQDILKAKEELKKVSSNDTCSIE